MTVKLSIFQEILTSGLLILFMLVPFQLQTVKLALILVVLAMSIASKQIYLSKKCILWNIAFVFYNGLYLLFSFIRNNPAPTHYIPTYILWPILFAFLSGTINYNIIHHYITTIKICLILNMILGVIAFVYFNITLQPDGSLFSFSAGMRPGFPFLVIASPIITDFLFWFFFFFTLFFIQTKPFDTRKILFLLLGIIFIFATSRRVLFINFGISLLFITFSIKLISGNKTGVKKRILNSIIGISAFIFCTGFVLIANDLIESGSMSDFLDKTGEASDGPRIIQTKALIDGWLKYPLFGAGSGIDAEVSRSDIPGTYELSYLAKLFEVGLFGIILYVFFWILLFYWTFRTISNNLINHNYIIALICAMLIFLIGNATNPYLSAFDYMWFMYTPFVAINLNEKLNRKYVHY